jgi:succinate-acetate transporter protein
VVAEQNPFGLSGCGLSSFLLYLFKTHLARVAVG